MSARSVVITGASSGIGAACVQEFAAAGYWTIGVDVALESEADEHLVIDLASPGCGDEVAGGIGNRSVVALINGAAIPTDDSLLETPVFLWDRVMAVNLRAPLLVARAIHSSLQAQRGAIVNIASVHAVATSPGAGAYAASKAGLVALTKSMALEWCPDIRVNALLPGAVDTPMLRSGMARTGQSVDTISSRHPLGRIALPSDIARAARYVATEDVFMTGSAILIDGGALSRLSTE